MVAKRFQNPEGGLNQAGRKHFKQTEGANLKRPLKTGTDPRRVSFAGRFAGMKGPMKDDKGNPTRKDTMKRHSKHHTARHMKTMTKLMEAGKSFSEAHKIALKEGK